MVLKVGLGFFLFVLVLYLVLSVSKLVADIKRRKMSRHVVDTDAESDGVEKCQQDSDAGSDTGVDKSK